MKTPLKKRLPSPARSQGAGPRTPIRHRHRRTLSVGSARSNASGRLTALIQQNRNMDSFAVSPLASRKSILSDNTDIEEPRRKSWWKKLGENTRDVTELLEENKNAEPNNIIEELDIEVLSQEKKNYTMELPESSDSESINSIVIPQRKLFTQKENLPQKKFGEIIGTRETLAKLHKTNNTNVDKSINVVTRELFQNNQRSKPIFPAGLLNISPNKTAADKTKEIATVEPKAQVRNIFGNRATKRKNIFTNFIVSESEDEIPEIQPKVFGFQKKIEAKRRGSSSSRGIREPSPTSSMTTDIEMDDWKMLPSSTMVEHQLEVMMADGNSPKRTRLSKLTEIEFEGSSNATKQSNKSVQSKEKSRKSKTFTKEKGPESNSAEEIFEQDEESSNKPRKSKTFTKEKASENSITTRKKSDGNVEQFEQDHGEQSKTLKDTDKSRKSKTFIKEKLPEAESMGTRNKSNVSQNGDGETLTKNREAQKDGDKSRKSKTFTKEKGTDLETSMTTRNKSKVSQSYEEEATKNKSKISRTEEIVQSQEIVNKSKSKIAELNISRASIKTRSQSNSNSPNTSQIIDSEIITENVESSDKTKSKSPKNTETQTPSDKENDDDELNFTLEYENEDQQNEEVPETIPNKSNMQTRASKSMNLQENSANVSKTNKTMPNKVIDESAEIESTQENSNQLLNGKNKSQATGASNIEGEIKSNYLQTEQHNDSENDELQKSIKNQSADVEDKNLQQEENEESVIDNNDESEAQNESEIEKSQEAEQSNEINEIEEDIEIASENEDEPDNVSQEIEDDDNNGSQEVEEENEEQNESQDEIQNESEVQNESQEENQNDSEDEHIESEEELQNDSGVQNESEVNDENEEEDEEQNISQEVDNEEQNESEVINENEEEDEEQNISQDVDNEEQNESEIENPESEGDADYDRDDGNNSQDANNSVNHDEIENDPEAVENEDEIETPNVSHDTTGRNRKKNASPEVILHDSNDHLESFAIRGRNTSVRKTEMIKTMNIRPSLAPVRESTGFSDGTRNSSAEGSGWDSHRTTKKTLRQTFGKDFSPRKSLRALVMEKSAKRQTQHNDLASVTAKFPQANSTELPEMSNRHDDDLENQEPIHEVSLRTRQTTLERYLQEIKEKNMETRLKMEEAARNSLNAPSKDHIFKMPAKPFFARRQTKPPAKQKQTKSTLFLGELPAEVIEDLKYKPPKRFQPSNAPWITKRLYKFLESKLEAKYDYKARVRAEKLVEHIYHFAKDLRRHDVATSDAVNVLKQEMARLDIVKTHFEFYEFFHQFMPREVRVKVVPDVVNKISLPRHGVFSDIL